MLIYDSSEDILGNPLCPICLRYVSLGDRGVDDFYLPVFILCQRCKMPLVISGLKIVTLDPKSAYRRMKNYFEAKEV